MPILDRDGFFNSLHERIGTDTSEEAIQFLENMTDTYNDLENRIRNGGEDWEQRYHELDNAWRERYRHRFYDSDSRYIPDSNEPNSDPGDDYRPEEVTVDDLFS